MSTDLGFLLDELLHQVLTFLIIQDNDFDTPASQKIFFAHESFIFTNDDSGNFIQQDGACAHAAWTGNERGSVTPHNESALKKIYLNVVNCILTMSAATCQNRSSTYHGRMSICVGL